MSKIYFRSFAVAFLFIQFPYLDAKKMSVEQLQNISKPMGKSCAKKVNLSPELQEVHRRGEFPEDEQLMSYLYCYCKATKILNQDDQLDLNYVYQQLELFLEEADFNRMKNVFETCKSRMTETEPHRLAWGIAKCYSDMDKDTYMFSY